MGGVSRSPGAHRVWSSEIPASVRQVKGTKSLRRASWQRSEIVDSCSFRWAPSSPSQETCCGVSSQLFRRLAEKAGGRKGGKERCDLGGFVRRRGSRSSKEAARSCNHSIYRNDVEPLTMRPVGTVSAQLLWKDVSSRRARVSRHRRALHGYVSVTGTSNRWALFFSGPYMIASLSVYQCD